MARRKSGRPRPLPLEHRLPNPGGPFLGREEETRRLDEALALGPVTLVVGPGGIGKTALVLATLHASHADRVGQALYVGVPPDEPVDQLRYQLVRLLAAAEGSDLDIDALRGEPDAMLAAAIDLAEASSRVVVLDDVHHGEADGVEELLTRLATYARNSRWIATSRRPIPPLARHSLELGAMADRDLLMLAEAMAPSKSADAARRAVRAATGSPWMLQQLVSMGDTARELSRDELLAELPPRAATFLERLAVLRAPMPTELVASFAPIPDDATMAQLERRGLVQHAEGRIRMHDVLRGLFFEAGVDPRRAEAARAAAEALGASDDPDAALEAARLLAELPDLAALRVLLKGRGDELLAHGLAPRLWQILGRLSDPELVQLTLRCAAELGNATALSAVDAPAKPDDAERFAWAQTLYAQGDVAQARREAGAAARRGGPAAADAHLLAARCALHLLDLEGARVTLEALPGSGPFATRRDAQLAYRAALMGDRALADRVLGAWRASPADEVPQEAMLDLAAAFEALGRNDAADELLEDVLATPRGGQASLLVARRALVLRARIRLEAGELVEAAAILDLVRPYSRAPSLLRPFVLELDAGRALAVGELEGLEARLDVAAREAEPVDRRCHARVSALAWRLASERATPPPSIASIDLAPEAIELAWLTGASAESSTARHRVHERIAAGRAALAAGHPGRALEHADNAAREAALAEQRLLQARAMALGCDAAVCGGLWSELPDRAAALADLAGWMGSERWRACAELVLSADDPSTLERLAAEERVAPRVARRARALLGGAPAMDEVDDAVVGALRAHTGLRVETVLARGAGWEAGWGLDDRVQRVWTSAGAGVDLSSRALLWRVLVTLLEGGGTASKEELVLAAWDEREYHPGRHDAKLHVSIRKLRQTIEDDSSRPERLLTTDTGYRLGGVVRRATRAG